jgi:ADP-ribose pyrophosphatase
LIQVGRGTFEGPEGQRFERDLVHHPGAVVVVPLIDDGTALLVRQYRAAVDAELLEVPAGTRDVEGEATEVTAARELAEEAGRRAGRIELLARFYNSPGFCDELSWLYLARDLTVIDDNRQGIEEEAMTVEEVQLAMAPSLIRSGHIVDAKTIIGLTLAAQMLSAGS